MKKKNGALISVAVLSLTLAFAAGCGDGTGNENNPPATTYDITVTGGTADKTTAAEGETITLTPNAPETGKEFGGWEVNGTEITGNTFEMPDEDVTVVAVFEDIEYTITVTGGTADKTTAIYGETVTLTPNAPETGKQFEGWEVNGSEIDGNTFEMPAENVTAEAVFADVDYTITVTGGTADKTTANMGDVVTLTPAAAQAGKKFAYWQVNGEKIDGNTFEMPAENTTVVAVYTDVYTITVTGGTADKATAEEGETVTLTADVPEGQQLSAWKVNGEEITGNTFEMPAENVTAEAVFEYIDYTIGVTGGTADKQVAHLGETVTLTNDEPEAKHAFSHWEVNGKKIEGNTFEMPAENVTAVAVFVETERTLATPDNSDNKLIYKEDGKDAIAFDRAAASMFEEGKTDHVVLWIYTSPDAEEAVGCLIFTANEPYGDATRGMLATSDGEMQLEVNGQPANFYLDTNGNGYGLFFELLRHELGYAYGDGISYYFAAQAIAVETPVEENGIAITYTDSAVSAISTVGMVKDSSAPGEFYTVKVEGGLIDGNLTEVTTTYGTIITLSAEEQDGKLFAGWFLVDAEGTLSEQPLSASLTYEHKVTGAATIKAVFTEESQKITLSVPDNSTGDLLRRADNGAIELDRVKSGEESVTIFAEGVDSVIYYIYTAPDAQKDAYVGQFRLRVDKNADMAGGTAMVGWIETVDGTVSYNVVRGAIGNYYVDGMNANDFYDLLAKILGYDYSYGQTYYFAAQAIAAAGSVYEDSDISAIGPNGFARNADVGNERYTVKVEGGFIDGTETQITAGYGVKVTLTADEPAEGYIFAHWALFEGDEEKDVISGSSEFIYTVTGNADLRAVYIAEGETIQLATPDNSQDQMIKFSGNIIEYDRQKDAEGNPVTAFGVGVDRIVYYIYTSNEADAQPIASFSIVLEDGQFWLEHSDGERMTVYSLKGDAGNLYSEDGNAHNFIKAAVKKATGKDWGADGATYYIACQAQSADGMYEASDIGAKGQAWGAI